MHRTPLTRIALLFALALLAIPAFAQVSGRVVGSVLDRSGAAIPNAKISLQLAGSTTPAYTAIAGADGAFVVPSVRPEKYDVTVEAPGFVKAVLKDLVVNTGRDTSAPGITLDVQSVTESVEVTAVNQTVNTTNSEVATTITNTQIQNLPALSRSPLAFLGTQAGINTTARGNTTINGQRTTFSNVTLDGINVQDNYIRTNALDFLPNLLLTDQVAEVTLTTSNANPALGGGSAQVAFITPSGTNSLHGKAYEMNRNNALAANDFFNNRDGIGLPFLNQNQFGGSAGGRIIKDKLFFYANFERLMLRQQASTNRTILTSDARNGIYTYRDSSGAVKKVNVLTLAGVSMPKQISDVLAQVPDSGNINNYRVGDSSESLLRNTAGYSFLMRNNRTRNNATGKLDYNFSTKNTFTGTFTWNSDLLDRTDSTIATNYSKVPNVKNDNTTKFLSVGWRYNPTPSITNELRYGMNLAPGVFLSDVDFGSSIVTGFVFSNPLNTFRNQGRYTNTYVLNDNGSWVHGKHNVQFGYQSQYTRVESFNDASNIPTYTIGLGTGNQGLVSSQLPGVSSSDLTAANNLLASLAGYVTSYAQTFQVTSRTSGYVNGAGNRRNFKLDNYAFYGQDNWKVSPRLTATAGLRWDYFTPMRERDGLYLLPVIASGSNVINTLLNTNGTLDFAPGDFYNKDKNNFAPNLGLAYDLSGNGKTSLRAGYSLSYVNDNIIRAVENSVNTNSGLSAAASRSGLSGTVANLPGVAVPTYKVPRTYADNYALSSTNAFGMPDPNLRTPYVQQWAFGIQHEIKGNVIEVRYIGNHGTKLFRAIDYNQVMIGGGFLDDFKRARNNGFLAQAAGKGFDPSYNSAIAGSQPLTVFPQLASGGLLTNSTIRSYLQTGEVGELANVYQTNGLQGNLNFYRNQNALGTNMMTNYSNSSYNGLQIDVQRRLTKGFAYQMNYVWSKALGDSQGDQQTNFEPFLDINNAKIERSRTYGSDLRHIFKANAYYELPIGPGHAFNPHGMDRVLGGWNVAGTFVLQAGTPFSVLSGRGTLNRAGRSTYNTVNTTLNGSQLNDVFQFRMTGIGPYYVAASALGSDGRAVAGDGATPFTGQVFSQPDPGSIGAIQRFYFSGPSVWESDFKISKNTRLFEKHLLELRLEALNIFNHQGFYIGDQTVTSTSFGRITSTFFSPRRLQIGLFYSF